jgi:hypothetical protein
LQSFKVNKIIFHLKGFVILNQSTKAVRLVQSLISVLIQIFKHPTYRNGVDLILLNEREIVHNLLKFSRKIDLIGKRTQERIPNHKNTSSKSQSIISTM